MVKQLYSHADQKQKVHVKVPTRDCQGVCVCVCTPHVVVSRVKEGMTGGTMARHQLKGKHQVFYSSSSLYVSIKPELGKENLLLNPLPSC